MLVYVISRSGRPLMPTERCGKVRKLLNSGMAKAVKRCPFTIQLQYETGEVTQPTALGIDAGSRVIGASACTEKKELFSGELEMRTDITKNLSERREFRRSRRYRKTRYRKPRFDNRVHSKHKGWLAPSVEAKINAHLKYVTDICRILPVSSITVETASFDVQKLKAIRDGDPLPEGEDYQHGEQLGFWNVREYVLWRDGHTCQCCKGKSKDRILNVHHIESRQTGGDAPGNLITLCETCHKQYHSGKISLPENISRRLSLRDASFMGIMRWTFYNRLKELYPGIVSHTYGYITKNTRITHGIEKTHAADARCISGHPEAEPLGYYYFSRKVRCHNRKLHKTNTLKGGIRKPNQAAKEVLGFKLFDRVIYKGKECFVFGRRTRGLFNIRTLSGEVIHTDAPVKDITLIEHTNTILTERRPA